MWEILYAGRGTPRTGQRWVEAFNSHETEATMEQLAEDDAFDDIVTD